MINEYELQEFVNCEYSFESELEICEIKGSENFTKLTVQFNLIITHRTIVRFSIWHNHVMALKFFIFLYIYCK